MIELEATGATAPPPQPQAGRGFTVFHQTVELDIDLAARSLRGKTVITVIPHSKELKTIKLNCRQCTITRLKVNGKVQAAGLKKTYQECAHLGWEASPRQHHMLSKNLRPFLNEPPEEELVITLSKSTRIEELKPDETPNTMFSDLNEPEVLDILKAGNLSKYTPLVIHIEYLITEFRDGLHFVGLEEGDSRYPHVYTRHSMFPGTACCLFPCVDNISERCLWDIKIKCPRTVGDIYRPKPLFTKSSHNNIRNTQHLHVGNHGSHRHNLRKRFNPEDEALEMMVICSGDMTDEIVDPENPSKSISSFTCGIPMAAQHIGFAIGPFEHVKLSEFRETEEDDQLGRNAVPVHGYSLPGRSNELRNTCLPMAKAIDYITLEYGSYPFSSYKMCFVDDFTTDTFNTAALSLCSNRLLFPESIVDPIDEVTRSLVYALASQWIGVNIIPDKAQDMWLVVGIAYFIADSFIRRLCGNNDYRYRQKKSADLVCDLDILRPSLADLGTWLAVDSSELQFMALKAPLVLFILDRRIAKASGHTGLNRIISKLFLNAKIGELPNKAVSTAGFQRICERLGHLKLDVFFKQWVFNAGCPRFEITQRFNKKKLVVEMLIIQKQGAPSAPRDLKRETFFRDAKEENKGVYAGVVQNVFSGPMTIRIHEADGTPYEHIVEIREATTKFEIPYNTKYKRLKRSRRQKERAAAAGMDLSGDVHDDVLLYCLGDVLQSEEEITSWQLNDWSKEDEERMSQESYEWIRMDADFEWICQIAFGMPGYMYASQLQQDRDVVAQLESVHYIGRQKKQPPIISTLLVRTLMDRRYFHGIRTTAAELLVNSAKEDSNWMGLDLLEKAFQELYCLPDSPMTRSNDFSDRASYYVQCAILKAISRVRDNTGKAPMRVKQFLLDKLKFNDNSDNEFSDCFYVSTLLNAIADSFLPDAETVDEGFNFEDEDEEQEDDSQLLQKCLNELERYQRMDEWLPSYQNIYAQTALNCKMRLAQAGRIKVNFTDYLPYTREGSLDTLRLSAFRNLLELKGLRTNAVLEWFLWVMGYDPSPYLRESMHRLFGLEMATIAFGDDVHDETQHQDKLVIEQDVSTEARQEMLSRRQTVEGALKALKTEKIIRDNESLAVALWKAVRSPIVSLSELGDLLDICNILYEAKTSMIVKLMYPRYWRVESEGKGKLKFSKTGRTRTTLIEKRRQPPAPPTQPPTKRQNTGASTRLVLKPPKKMVSEPRFPSPSPEPRPKTLLKLRVNHPSRPP